MNPSIFYTDKAGTIYKELDRIGVDKYGIKIMVPKALMRLVRISGVSGIAANILKQEMLGLGADVAVSRDILTGRTKTTDCIIMGNLVQFNRLGEKLKKQPFGLAKIGVDIREVLSNYERSNFVIDLEKNKLNLGTRTRIMAVVNMTPDSFSGDGLYNTNKDITGYIEKLVKDGADIIDVGGESTRPGAKPVSVKDQINRTIPLIKRIAKTFKIPISIDTYKSEVAKRALDYGATIVNDISALRLDRRMSKVVASYKAGVVLMHMKGKPSTMQKNPRYESLIEEIISSLSNSINIALEAGVAREKIIIDPGIGFGKTLEHNLEILRRLREFKSLGRPILVGVSRKSFIGKILNTPADQCVFGTAAAVSVAIANGANIIRVHDVEKIRQVVKICDAIRQG